MTENMPTTRDDLVARLRRAGELEVSGDNHSETDSYFDTRQFRFHGPDGVEADYSGLTNYFKAIRAASESPQSLMAESGVSFTDDGGHPLLSLRERDRLTAHPLGVLNSAARSRK